MSYKKQILLFLTLLSPAIYINSSAQAQSAHPLKSYATNDFTAANFICDVSHQLYRKGAYDDAVYELKVALIIDPDNVCALSFMQELGVTQSELDAIPFKESDENVEQTKDFLATRSLESAPVKVIGTSSSLKAYQDEIQNLKLQLDTHKSKLQKVEQQNSQLNKEKNELQRIAQDLENVLNDQPLTKKDISSNFIENTTDSTYQDIAKVTEDISFAYDQRINMLENELDEKQYLIEEKNIELRELKKVYEDELSKIRNQISIQNNNQANITSQDENALKRFQASYESKLKDAHNQLKTLEEDYKNQLTLKNDEIKSSLSSSDNTISTLKRNIHDLEQKLRNADDKYAQAMTENRRLMEASDKFNEQLTKEKQYYENLHKEDYYAIRELNEKVIAKDKDIAGAHRETQDHKNIIHKLHGNIESFKLERENNRQLVEQLSDDLNINQQTIKQLEKTAEIKEKTIVDLQDRIERHQDRIHELEDLFAQAVKKLEKYRESYKNNTEFLDKTIDEIKNLN